MPGQSTPASHLATAEFLHFYHLLVNVQLLLWPPCELTPVRSRTSDALYYSSLASEVLKQANANMTFKV